MSALAISLAGWLSLALPLAVVVGRHLKHLRRAHPLVRTAANDDFIRSSPFSSRRRARRGR